MEDEVVPEARIPSLADELKRIWWHGRFVAAAIAEDLAESRRDVWLHLLWVAGEVSMRWDVGPRPQQRPASAFCDVVQVCRRPEHEAETWPSIARETVLCMASISGLAADHARAPARGRGQERAAHEVGRRPLRR